MTILQSYWSPGQGAQLPRTSTASSGRTGPTRLSVLTEDVLTPEQAAALEDRLQNPPLATRTPQPVRAGNVESLLQAN